MDIVHLIFEKISFCRNSLKEEEEEEIKIISFFLHFLIVNNTNLLNDTEIIRFLQTVHSCVGQIDKRIEKYLDNSELQFSRKVEVVLIYLKYFFSFEKKNVNSNIKNCVLDWIKDNNEEMKAILSASIVDDEMNLNKISQNDLLTITRLFNIYLMLKYISNRLYHNAFKDNYVSDFINAHYKQLLKYYLDKEPEALDTPDRNNFILLFERNSSLFGFLLKKNSFDIKEFTKETHENFDLQYLIN